MKKFSCILHILRKIINDPRVQVLFKRSRHLNKPVFVISSNYYELPRKFYRPNGKIDFIFQPNNYKDFQKLYQDKASIDKTHNGPKISVSNCWIEKNQPLTIVMTKAKYTGLYRLGQNSSFFPHSCPF